MSYKELEAEIKAWANLEAHAKAQKEQAEDARRQAKRDKRIRKLSGKKAGVLVPKRPAPKLDKPLKTWKRVTIECRPIMHRKWGELTELTYEFEAMTDAVGEVFAIKKAREDGYSYDRLVCIVTFEK